MAYTTVLAVVILRLNAILEKIGNAEEKNEVANKEFYLPMEILRLIVSRLSLKDNVRASSVCKAWHEAAFSVQGNSPWLVYFNIDPTSVSYGFYDPTEKKKTKPMKLPNEPFNASLCYSKNGWLLLMVNYQEDGPTRLVFFNPFTRVHIMLPRLIAVETFGDDFAFSCAPTNESCVVCCISNRTKNRSFIHTWYHGAAEWVTGEFHKPAPLIYRGSNNIIISGGCFWFPDQYGLGIFDPIAFTWEYLHVPLPKPIPNLMWITEYKGNIFLASLVPNGSQMGVVLFGLDRSMLVWEKKETFDGLSFFISEKSSVVTNELTGDMSNIVCVWDSRLSKFLLCTWNLCTDQDGSGVDPSTDGELLDFGTWIEPPPRHLYP